LLIAKQSFLLPSWNLLVWSLGLNRNYYKTPTMSKRLSVVLLQGKWSLWTSLDFISSWQFLLVKRKTTPSLGFPNNPFEDSSSMKVKTVLLCLLMPETHPSLILDRQTWDTLLIYLWFFRKDLQRKRHVDSMNAP
jgi:hypothetical protein